MANYAFTDRDFIMQLTLKGAYICFKYCDFLCICILIILMSLPQPTENDMKGRYDTWNLFVHVKGKVVFLFYTNSD